MSDHRDVATVRDRLAAIIRACTLLDAQAADIHGLAYERTVGEANEGHSVRAHWYLDEIGVDAARKVWHQLERGARLADNELGIVAVAISSIIGGPAAEPMRGTLISREEFKSRMEAQQRRQHRADTIPVVGDYQPARSEPQPNYPGPKAEPKKKRGRRG